MEEKTISVLLVEDNPGDARLIREMLADATQASPDAPKFDLVRTTKLSTGLKRLARGGIDVVLLDLTLPDSDGLDTFVKMDGQTPETPIIVLSDVENRELALEAVQKGAQDYLVKDEVSGSLLVCAIRYAIERKRAEQMLRESEEEFRTLFDSAGDAIFTHDLDGHFLEINQVACARLGYSREELLQMTPADIDAPEYAVLVPQRIEELRRRGHVMFETAHVRRDGTQMPIELSSRVIEYAGKPAIMSIARDITERKQVEEELRKKEAHQTLALGSLPMAFYIAQPFGDYGGTWASEQIHRISGFTAEQFTEDVHLWASRLHPEDKERVLNAFSKLPDTGTIEIEYRWQAADGRYLWILDRGVLVRSEDGEPKEITGTWLDITGRKQAEETLRESEEKYRQLFELESDALFLIDNESGRILEANAAASALYGYSHEELLTRRNTDLSAKPEDTQKVTQTTPITNQVVTIPVRFHRNKDGTVFPVEITGRFFDKQRRSVHIAAIRDITERKRAEEALQESEERFRQVLESLQDVAYRRNLQTDTYDYMSPAQLHISGYTAEEVLSMPTAWVVDRIHPDDLDHVTRVLEESMAGGDRSYHLEYRFKCKDGQYRWMSDLFTVIEDTQGRPLYRIGTVRDITERRQAEEALRDSQKRFQALVETTGDFIWEMDSRGVYTYCSPQLRVLWGLDPKEMVGKTPFDLLPHEDREQAVRAFSALAESTTAFRNLEVRSFDAMGNVRFLEISGVPFCNAAGELKGYRGITRDITERKRAEEALRKAELEKETILDSQLEHVIYQDREHKILWPNQAACESAQMTREELIGRHCYEVWAQRGERCEDCPVALAMETGKQQEIEKTTPDGKAWFIRGCPVRDTSGQIVGAIEVTRDITERKRAEETLRESEEKYRQLFELESDALFLIDNESSRILEANAAASALYGYSHEELLTKRNTDLSAEPEDTQKVTQTTPITNQVVTIPVRFHRNKDGTVFPVEITGRFFDRQGQSVHIAAIRDITERKRAEETLRESERKLRDAQALGRVGNWEFDIESQKITWSDQTYRLYERDPALGPPTAEEEAAYYSPEQARLLREYARRAIAEKKDFEYDLEAELPGGRRVYFTAKVHPIEDEHGRVVELFGTVQDITERKQAEEALRESEERYRVLVEGSAMGVGVSRGNQVILANPALLQIFGYDNLEEFSRVPLLDHVAPSSREMIAERVAKVDRGEPMPAEFEYEIVRKDGQIRTLQASSSSVTLGGENYRQTTFQDITERRQAEEERERLLAQIREQAQRVQQIMDTVPEGVILMDTEHRTVLANPMGQRDLNTLAGAQVGDVLTHLGGCPLAEILTSPPKGLWHEVALGNRSFQIIARPIENGPVPKGWVLVIRDVTQQRETERRIQQQERLVAVGQLAAGIAHDFNNIMAVISLYAGMMLHTPGLPEKTYARLETVKQQAGRASSLIQQVLDFSRRAVLERGPIDMLIFLKEQSDLLRRTLPENIKIDLTYDKDEYVVRADPTRIQQAIVNLATNARDAMPEGGQLRIGLDRIHVQDRSSAPLPEMEIGDWVRVTVADTGTGIPPDVMEHIFDPFFTTKPPGQGTGLGLAQVYGIVKQHDGYIDVSTTVGEGTTLTLYLPALSMQQAETPPPRPQTLVAGQGQTILVIEDEVTTRRAIVDSLEPLGYQVLEAADGQKALAIFEQREGRVDLVLSDVVMPEMGGKALFRALKQRYPGVKVVLMSGHPLEETEIETLLADGLTDWLPKPPSLEQLARVVAQALAEDTRQSEPSGSKPLESE